MTIALKVLDLSHHNLVNSFQQLRDYGIVGVILKATQGIDYKDPTYPGRRTAAAKAGLLVGAYHFGDGSDTEKQLEHFLDYAALEQGDIGCLDFEQDTTHHNTMDIEQARDWMANFDATKPTSSDSVLYSGNLIKEKLRGKDDFLGSHKLWLAQYAHAPVLPPAWSKLFLWQYTDGASGPNPVPVIPGVRGYVDCNNFDGTDSELRAAWVS